jgi:hypothetical protein
MGSTLDPEHLSHDRARKSSKGREVRSLGPSDSSDTGADVAGSDGPLDDTSNFNRADEEPTVSEERARPGDDIGTDPALDPEDAGVGQGIDEADEAWLEHERGEH